MKKNAISCVLPPAVAVATALAANAYSQGTLQNNIYNWNGTLTVASDGGSVFYPGANVKDAILSINFSDMTPDGIGGYGSSSSTISYGVSYNGTTVQYNYTGVDMDFSSTTGIMNIAWNNANDVLTLDSSQTISLPQTPSGIQAALASYAQSGYDTYSSGVSLDDASLVNWGVGSVTSFTAAPVLPASSSLSIQSSNQNAIISWPTNGAANLNLYSCASLLGTNWSAVNIAPAILNGTNFVTIPATNPMAFFRLQSGS
jgi:hypothetical protein